MKLRDLPNILSIIRLLLVIPISMYLLNGDYKLACYLFVIAGITDGLDGFFARRFGWMSRFGSIVDPLADKLLIVVSFATLTWLDFIPLWLFIIVFARDLLIVLGVGFCQCILGNFDFKPNWVSKVNTFLQIMLVIAILVNLSFFTVTDYLLDSLMIAVFSTSALSLLIYAWEWGGRIFRQRGPIK